MSTSYYRHLVNSGSISGPNVESPQASRGVHLERLVAQEGRGEESGVDVGTQDGRVKNGQDVAAADVVVDDVISNNVTLVNNNVFKGGRYELRVQLGERRRQIDHAHARVR